jgi:3-phosphoshikimate 1-carboxyvinyltransferase
MSLPDLLPIQPFTHPVRGEVILPGSKSLTNRALLLAALCDSPVTLTGALFSEDTEIMAEALKQLGFTVALRPEKNEIKVEGRGGKIPNEKATLHVGLAGTAARFLTALCAAAPCGVYHIDGVPQMRKRPMKGLFDALQSLGAEIIFLENKDHFPIEIRAHGFREMTGVKIDASESSQMLSALMMVAPLSPNGVMIELASHVREPFVEMTWKIMVNFGAVMNRMPGPPLSISIQSWQYRLHPPVYPIEPDATAASYFLALPLVVRGVLHLPNLHIDSLSLQGDTRFADVLRGSGAIIQERKEPVRIPKDVGKSDDRTVGVDSAYYASAKPKSVTQDFREFSDTFLTLAAISPLLDGPTRITGIAHTRSQETDRVAGMARELKKLGQHVIETEDSLEIHPRPLTPGVEIETYGDHRFAMSFAILGCHDLLGNGQPWLTIKNPACCAKTFPNFFDVLNELRTNSHLSQ